MAFGKLFSRLSSIEEQFKNVDSKIENYQKQTVFAIDKLDSASKNLADKTDKKIAKIDKVSKKLSEKLKSPTSTK